MNTATVTKITYLTDDVFQLNLKAEQDINFQAGQFITIKIDDKVPPCFRAYSICSAPAENSRDFFLCIKQVQGGRGTSWISQLKEGDQVNYIGPNGYFTYAPSENNIFFIATGTGLAPFYSMITELLNKGESKNITLLFGVRHQKDLFYLEYFNALQNKHSNFKFITTLSQSENPDWDGNQGRVTKYLEENEIPKNTDFYICGLTPMIDSATSILKDKGFPEEQVHFEKYD